MNSSSAMLYTRFVIGEETLSSTSVFSFSQTGSERGPIRRDADEATKWIVRQTDLGSDTVDRISYNGGPKEKLVEDTHA